jgi:two-component system, OmpR family, response regulator
MNKQSILLLEDDKNLGFILKEHLELNGFDATLCTNGIDGLSSYQKGGYALCLVDIMMPKKDGFAFAREIRMQDQDIPLIFLTAKALKEDRIEGFKIGCDDYVTKPFSMEELLLRIQAVLKRSAPASGPIPTSFSVGKYRFDFDKQILEIDGSSQKLTTKEAELLRLLCLNMNRTLEREVALRTIWNDDSYFNGRSMDVFISRLRKYFSGDPKIEIINVHGKGFKLVVESKTP